MKKQFPPWIKKNLTHIDKVNQLESLFNCLGINTVCKSASCPNRYECFSQKKVTFMILGNICTRSCCYCSVKKGSPLSGIDKYEPKKLSNIVNILGIKHVIITSVTRDDLEDGGATQFLKTVCEIKNKNPNVIVEVLTPDFNGNNKALDIVLSSPIDIFGHNIETVYRLFKYIRPQGNYKRSLALLKRAKSKIKNTKSGIMVGLGETEDEVMETMRDLKKVGCELLTIGQYLQPSPNELPVYKFIHPDTFKKYKIYGLSLGFKQILSSPFARSSYM